MVFTTLALFVRNKGPDKFWKKRRILKLSAVRYFEFQDSENVYKLVILKLTLNSALG
jgi:hypothetical protein